MVKFGSIAIANIQGQVTVVQASRSHACNERWIDVYTYTPFGVGLFIVTEVPNARIKKSDILRIIDTPKSNAFSLTYLGDSTTVTMSSYHNYAGNSFSDSASTLGSDEVPEEMLEVSPEAYREFTKLREENERRCESLWKRISSSRRR